MPNSSKFSCKLKKFFAPIFFVPIFCVLLSACANHSDNDARVELSLPSTYTPNRVLAHNTDGSPASSEKVQGAASLDPQTLEHVFINISGPNLKIPVNYSWERCENCQTVPTSFQLNVPIGSNYLIQVLAVYGDDSDSTLLYGDSLEALGTSLNNVNVSVSPIGPSGPLISGRISGRYLNAPLFLNAPDQGPTGMVNMLFNPPGKPPMLIEKSFIVNGWFSFFGIKSIPFTYRTMNGQVLFENTKLDDFRPSAAAINSVGGVNAKFSRTEFLDYARVRTDGATTVPGAVYIHGYYGAGDLSSKMICWDNTVTTFDRIRTPVSLGTYNLSTSILDSSNAKIEGAAAMSSNAAACFTNPYTNVLNIHPRFSFENGNDSVAGFRGIFQSFDLDPGTGVQIGFAKITKSPTDSNVQITVKALPGVQAVMPTVRIFKSTSGKELHEDVLPCDALQKNLVEGFSKVGEVNFLAATNVLVIPVPIPQTERSQTTLILCPANSAGLTFGAMMLDPYYFTGP